MKKQIFSIILLLANITALGGEKKLSALEKLRSRKSTKMDPILNPQVDPLAAVRKLTAAKKAAARIAATKEAATKEDAAFPTLNRASAPKSKSRKSRKKRSALLEKEHLPVVVNFSEVVKQVNTCVANIKECQLTYDYLENHNLWNNVAVLVFILHELAGNKYREIETMSIGAKQLQVETLLEVIEEEKDKMSLKEMQEELDPRTYLENYFISRDIADQVNSINDDALATLYDYVYHFYEHLNPDEDIQDALSERLTTELPKITTFEGLTELLNGMHEEYDPDDFAEHNEYSETLA